MTKHVVSLFDFTGNIVRPWRSAGFTCWIIDIQHPPSYGDKGVTKDEHGIYRVHHDLRNPWLPPFDRRDIAFVAAFPPCDHLAVSGAAWFKGKGLRKLASSIELFATAAEFCVWAEAPYFIENPKSVVATHWRAADYTFHPWEFSSHASGDVHSKETFLWTGGGFIMPKRKTELVTALDTTWVDNKSNKNDRSETPRGFAKAVFLANQPRIGV
jgi:hypothetical protein